VHLVQFRCYEILLPLNMLRFYRTISRETVLKLQTCPVLLPSTHNPLIIITSCPSSVHHTYSLTNLSKYPASTLQILGAEKALFRALKTKGNTPKYGLIYHSAFIGRAGTKNKGRISRFLANKCSIASRIDNFSDAPTSKFGEALRKQVEERIDFYASGTAPTKNEVAMRQAMDAVLGDIQIDDPTAGGAEDVEMADGVTSQAVEQKLRKEKKTKDKKSKKQEPDTMTSETLSAESPEKTKKKEKKRKHAEEEDGKKKKKSKA